MEYTKKVWAGKAKYMSAVVSTTDCFTTGLDLDIYCNGEHQSGIHFNDEQVDELIYRLLQAQRRRRQARDTL